MQAAIDLIAQVPPVDEPQPGITEATIDQVHNMAQTVKQMILNAYLLISKANKGVDVKHDKIKKLKQSKTYHLVQYADEGANGVDKLLQNMKETVKSDYDSRERLERELISYLRELLNCSRGKSVRKF